MNHEPNGKYVENGEPVLPYVLLTEEGEVVLTRNMSARQAAYYCEVLSVEAPGKLRYELKTRNQSNVEKLT